MRINLDCNEKETLLSLDVERIELGPIESDGDWAEQMFYRDILIFTRVGDVLKLSCEASSTGALAARTKPRKASKRKARKPMDWLTPKMYKGKAEEA